jgi:hypothetical protein
MLTLSQPLLALTTISSLSRLTHLTLYICYEPAPNWNETRYNLRHPHFATDQSIAQEFFSYLQSHKTGREFQKIELMIGNFERHLAEGYGRVNPPKYSHPGILFTYQVCKDGGAIIGDDVEDEDRERWKEYFGGPIKH